MLEISTKIQGAGRGVFAAKSFDKDEIISVYIWGEIEHITPYSLEINRILISPYPEELWLGAHLMNDCNFNTVTV